MKPTLFILAGVTVALLVRQTLPRDGPAPARTTVLDKHTGETARVKKTTDGFWLCGTTPGALQRLTDLKVGYKTMDPVLREYRWNNVREQTRRLHSGLRVEILDSQDDPQGLIRKVRVTTEGKQRDLEYLECWIGADSLTLEKKQ
jgi:hypothetical protein